MIDPAVTGLSVVVDPGQAAPEPWAGAAVERVVVAGTDPGLADVLVEAWRERRPLVIELEGGRGFDDPALPPPDEGPSRLQPWEWPVDLRLLGDEIHHGVWANSIDARSSRGGMASRWADAAVELGCRSVGQADPAAVVLPDGTAAVCDGGPLDASLSERTGVAVLHRVGLEHGRLHLLGGSPEAAVALAPDQLAAVNAPLAGGRVIAPAGSGKTRVLTERARVLLESWQLPPAAVALVAYNVRAREELQQRLSSVAGTRIRTLNALSLRLAGDVKTIDEREVRQRLSRFVDIPRKADADPLAVWLEALTRVRLGLRHPEEVAEDLPDVSGLTSVVSSYRAALADRGEVDFDEQVVRAISRLLGEPAFRRTAQRSARVLLVDEFQDLTPAHLLLLRLLSGPAGAVFGVGDDDQTIYGYAGASPRWLVDFTTWFPGSAEHALEVNYRCPPAVVTAASNLLTRNSVRVAKTIRPRPGRAPSAGDLDVRPATPDPARATAERVVAAVAEGAAAHDVAVLCRVNSLLAPVQVLLQDAGVAVRSPVDERFLARSTVRAVMAWCAVASGGSRAAAWKRLEEAARRPRRGMSESLRALAGRQRSVGDLQSLARWLEGKGSVRDATKIEELARDVEVLTAAAAADGTAGLLRALRHDIGLDSSAAALDGWSMGTVASHEDDLDALASLAHLQPDAALFESWLRGELGRPPAADGVTLASVHAVKGREWPVVVVHHVSAGVLPHRLVDDIEEERRVFHVAITRSSTETIVVPGPQPSPFLSELAAPGAPPAGGSGRLGAGGRGSGRGSPAAAGGGVGPGRSPASPRGPGAARGSGAKPAGSAVDALTPDQRVVFDALKKWRTGVARATGKPAFTVLQDSTLAELARARPRDERALARVPGIGPAKLEQYGDAILALIEELPR